MKHTQGKWKVQGDLDETRILVEKLRNHKEILINWIMEKGESGDEWSEKEAEEMEGLVQMIDHIQDNLAESFGEEAIFGKALE